MTSKKLFLVSTKGLTSYDIIILERIGTELMPSDIELLKNLLNQDITDWKESGDKYAEKREIQQDARLLKKLESL